MSGVIIEPFLVNWKDDSGVIGGGWPSNFNVFYFFVIKQLVHTSAVHSLGYKALGKFREQSRS